MDNNRLITVITVTRNASVLLKRTIDSVGAQNYDAIEYVVVDGGSSDGSKKIISESEVVSKWVSEPDKGIYDAMNKGARMATGEWLIFMNAGDTFADEDVISKLMSGALNHPESDVIYGDVIRCGDHEPFETIVRASDTLKGHRLAFCHQSVMCRREDLLQYPFDTNHRYSADFKFFKILGKQGKLFTHVNFPVAKFDTTGISSLHRSSGLMDNMKVIAEVDGIFGGLSSILHLMPTYIISRLRGK